MPKLLLLLILLVLIIFIISWILSNIVIKPPVEDYDKIYEQEVKEGRLDEELYQSWDKKEFYIKSEYGYQLSCMLINNEVSKKQFENPNEKIKIAILLHGYTRCKYSSMVYAKFFLKRGISVLVYDHRNHGLSGKAYTSMGYYEKYDLQTVIDYCYKEYDGNVSIITHGESMGAATVLSHLAIDTRVHLAIADCGFSDFAQLAKHLLKTTYHAPVFPFIYTSGLIIMLRARFPIQDVIPKEGVRITNKPVLFIHGLEDDFVPTFMSQEMYDLKADKKDILLVDGAGHGQSATSQPKAYEEKLNEFLDRYNF